MGKAGIGVDPQGGLVGYLAVCDQHVDGATLYFRDASASTSEATEVTVGKWASDQPVTSRAEWSLTDTSVGWTTTTALKPLEADGTYRLYGWTRDNSGSAMDVAFTPAEVQDLKPGQVYFFDHYDLDRKEDIYVTRSPSEFRKAACRP